MLTQEAKLVNWVTFVRFTDWTAWRSARKNLEETFNELETIYNIKDLENWIMKEVFK
jgi:type II restriction enzyme